MVCATPQFIAPRTWGLVPARSTSSSSPRTVMVTAIVTGTPESMPSSSIAPVARYVPSGRAPMSARVSRPL